MDLSKITTVRKSSVQVQNFDLRYKHSSGKFQLSDRFYTNKMMNDNGLTLHSVEDDGKTVALLSIRPHEESVFYKGKKGDADKDTNFSYSVLAEALRDLGMIGDGESARFENYRLEPVGEKDGYNFYVITRWESDDAEEETEEVANEAPKKDLTGEAMSQEGDAEEDRAVAPEPAEEEEEEYDPFE